MSPFTHALIGWGIAHVAPRLDRRSRSLVFFASVVPDLDGLTALGGAAAYQAYHRILCHNLPFALVCTAAGAAAATGGAGRRALVGGLVLLNFHIHLLCDFLGSAGPDGSIWGIPYLQPFSSAQIDNPHQWALNAWPNFAVTFVALGVALAIALRLGRTPVEAFSLRADRAVMEVIRRRLGRGAPEGEDDTGGGAAGPG